ncbi:hypothetical protein CcCBS67573_g00308 [Chytriomyces confervae]|uniref:Aldehyde dehydrogenase n=1 Tax=Chytriomyces confervae TaxID=246404 RepID=A0A507FS83_9FUNG|nr:Aldehyde dehydrogenase [Chytriomyces hyalinus]TPX78420.1 hypothetical protein CcCBS67573_g00308 [Chytriomyces confervae]
MQHDQAQHRPTDLDEIPKIVESLHAHFNTNKTKPIEWRREQLNKLYSFIIDQESLLAEALYKDLRKDASSIMADIMIVSREAAHTIEHLEEWTAPQASHKTLFTMFDNNQTLTEPLGVVCIIGAWNYPIQLVLGPMVAALAAGNCILLKPSEISTHCEALLAEWVPRIFDTDAVKIVTGGISCSTVLLQQKFDHIFYTGNGNVGRIIMQAAAKNLTPITLELGGKCPTYVDDAVNVDVVAKRLVWAKLLNAGQTCLAPDYVLVHKAVMPQLLAAVKKAISELYGLDTKNTAHYGRIINKNHTQRLAAVLERQLALSHSNVITGGEYDIDSHYVAPLVVAQVRETDPLMEDEIFGPLLPILEVENEDEAIRIINKRDHPLCLYINSDDKAVVRKIVGSTRSGTVSINDYLVNMIVSDLPFGGVGASGMGKYHGKSGILTFSNQRAMVWRKSDMLSEKIHELVYPPFGLKPLPFALVNYFTGYRKPSDFKLAFNRYVPVRFILGVVVVGLVFEIGRRVGRGGPFFA